MANAETKSIVCRCCGHTRFTRLCAQCNELMYVHSPNSPKVYCSEQCKYEARKLREYNREKSLIEYKQKLKLI